MDTKTFSENSKSYLSDTVSTRDKINALIDGKADLTQMTVAEYLQLSFIHALNSPMPLNLNQNVIYGGERYSMHYCIKKIGPSYSLDAALDQTQ